MVVVAAAGRPSGLGRASPLLLGHLGAQHHRGDLSRNYHHHRPQMSKESISTRTWETGLAARLLPGKCRAIYRVAASLRAWALCSTMNDARRGPPSPLSYQPVTLPGLLESARLTCPPRSPIHTRGSSPHRSAYFPRLWYGRRQPPRSFVGGGGRNVGIPRFAIVA